MRLRAAGSPGFTLAEVIIAMALISLLTISVLNLQLSMIRSGNRLQSRNIALSNTMLCVRRLARDISPASMLSLPAEGTEGNKLLAVFNVDPLDGKSIINPAKASTYFMYCADAAGSGFYRYAGKYPMPLAFTPLECGTTHPSAVSMEKLLDLSQMRGRVDVVFARPPGERNRLGIVWTLTIGRERISVNDSIAIEAAL
jgi:prepilin-type N-terminal cleavage/methylation domain-containing protein